MERQKSEEWLQATTEKLNALNRKTPFDCTSSVWRGSVKARVLVLCDSPNADDLESGFPFSGRCREVFDGMIRQIKGFSSDKHFMFANAVSAPLPARRDPTSQEMAKHASILKELIMIMKPELILCLGKYGATLIKSGLDVAKMYLCSEEELDSRLQAVPSGMVNVNKEEGQMWKVYLRGNNEEHHVCRLVAMRHPDFLERINRPKEMELWKARTYKTLDVVDTVGEEERLNECGRPYIIPEDEFSSSVKSFDDIEEFEEDVKQFMPKALRALNNKRLKQGRIEFYAQLNSSRYNPTTNQYNLHCTTPEGYSASGVLKNPYFFFYVSPHRAFFNAKVMPTNVRAAQLRELAREVTKKLIFKYEPRLYENGDMSSGVKRTRDEWRRLFRTPYDYVTGMHNFNKAFIEFFPAKDKRILSDGYQPKGRLMLKCKVMHQSLISDVTKVMRWIINKYKEDLVMEPNMPPLTYDDRLRVCNSNFSPELALSYDHGIRASHWLRFKTNNDTTITEHSTRHLNAEVKFVVNCPTEITCLNPYDSIKMYNTPLFGEEDAEDVNMTSSDHPAAVHCAMDIECGNADNKFPNAYFDPVVCISNTVQIKNRNTKYDKDNGFIPMDGHYDVSFMLGDCDLSNLKEKQKIYCFRNETQLIEAYFSWMRMLNPDRVIGHNEKNFDWNYLITRAFVLGVVNQVLGRNMNSRLRVDRRKFVSRAYGERIITELQGMEGWTVVDTLEVYLREKKEPSYRLDALAQKYIGCKKDDVPYSAIWGLFTGRPEDRRRLIDYCVRDARLCDQLVNKHCWDANMIEFGRVNGGVYENDLYVRGQQVKVLSALMHRIRMRQMCMLFDTDTSRSYNRIDDNYNVMQMEIEDMEKQLGLEKELTDKLWTMKEGSSAEEVKRIMEEVRLEKLTNRKRKRTEEIQEENKKADCQPSASKRTTKQSRLDLFTQDVPTATDLYQAKLAAAVCASEYCKMFKKVKEARDKGYEVEIPLDVVEKMEKARQTLEEIKCKIEWSTCDDATLKEEAKKKRREMLKLQKERREKRIAEGNSNSKEALKEQRKRVAAYLSKLEKELAMDSALTQREVQYKGAVVLMAIAGLHMKYPVLCVDFASLYPSIMLRYNISPDTKAYGADLERLGLTPDMCYKMPDPGYNPRTKKKDTVYFVKEDYWVGIFPDTEKDLLGARKVAKKKMAYYDKVTCVIDKDGNETWPENPNYDEVQHKNYNGRQAQIKIVCNSMYGALGAKGKMGDKDCASSVTCQGRDAIELVRDKLIYRYNANCVGGDTDSVFMQFKGFSLEQREAGLNPDQKHIVIDTVKKAEEFSGELEAFINSFFKKPMFIEYEKAMYPMLIMKKKRYCGIIWEKGKDGRFFSKGMETVRRDSLPFTKKTMQNVFSNVLLKRGRKESVEQYTKRMKTSVDDAAKYIQDRAKQLLKGDVPIGDLVMSKQLSREVYTNENAPHLQVKRNLIERGEDPPKLGERIPFLYIIKGKDHVTGKEARGYEMAEHPDYVVENCLPINYAHYLENCYIKPIVRVMKHILRDKIIRKLVMPRTQFVFKGKKTSKGVTTHKKKQVVDMVVGDKGKEEAEEYMEVREPPTEKEIEECCEYMLFKPAAKRSKERRDKQTKYANIGSGKYVAPRLEKGKSPLARYFKISTGGDVNETPKQELCRLHNTGTDWKSAYDKEKNNVEQLEKEYKEKLSVCQTCIRREVVICAAMSCKDYFPRKKAEGLLKKSKKRYDGFTAKLKDDLSGYVDEKNELEKETNTLKPSVMDIEDMLDLEDMFEL